MRRVLLALIGLLTLLPSPAFAVADDGSLSANLHSNVAYVKVSKLSPWVTQRIRTLAEELQGQKPRGVVLDMRGNAGGSIDAASAVIETLLPKGIPYVKLFSTLGTTLRVSPRAAVFRKSQPLVILIDGKTRNEARIIVSVLQKKRNGIVVEESRKEPSPTVIFGDSARMREYIPIDGKNFSVVPDRRVQIDTKGGNDGPLQISIGIVKEKSPWVEAKK